MTEKIEGEGREDRGSDTGGMIGRLIDEIDLMTRHLRVVQTVIEHQPIGILKLSELLDLPTHRVRYSLRVLEGEGYIRASPAGAVATERAREMLRHLDEQLDCIIEKLEGIRPEKPPQF
ncbi:MAG: hypothetical protein ACXQTN_02245 [Methanoculleaceae archaeon]